MLSWQRTPNKSAERPAQKPRATSERGGKCLESESGVSETFSGFRDENAAGTLGREVWPINDAQLSWAELRTEWDGIESWPGKRGEKCYQLSKQNVAIRAKLIHHVTPISDTCAHSSHSHTGPKPICTHIQSHTHTHSDSIFQSVLTTSVIPRHQTRWNSHHHGY